MSKITDYTAIPSVAPNDLLIAVDVSDTSMAATGTDKKVTVSQLPFDAIGAGTSAVTAATTALNTFSLDNYAGTDDQKMVLAIADVVAAGGGTIRLGARAHTFANQWSTSYVSSSVTTAVRITGGGVAFNGAWGTPSAATVCTFTCSTGVACMNFQHNGTIEISGIQFKSANAGIPLFQTTNATPNVHDCVFSGGGSGATCATDAILLGGTGTTIGSGDTAKYNAYQGLIYNNFFDGIRRAALFQSAANSIQFFNNTVSTRCGSNLFQGSPVEMVGNATKSCSGNAVYGNCIEVAGGGYTFAVRATYAVGNTLGPNGLFDMGAPYIAGYYLGPNTASNEIIDGYRTSVTAPLAWDAYGNNNRQRNNQRGAGQRDDFHAPVSFKDASRSPQSFYFGRGVVGVETTGNQGYWQTNAGTNPYPVVQVATIAATQFTDGSIVTGSRWITSLTAAFVLADCGQAIGGTGIVSLAQIELTVTASTAFAWQANTAYILGDIVRPTAANTHMYQCTTAGTSSGAQPTFPTDGSTIADGTAVWTDIGLSTAAWMSVAATATATGVTFGISRSTGSVLLMTGFSRHHIVSSGTAPSWAADTAGGAGSGATISLTANSNDLSQEVTLTTGTSVSAGLICHGAVAIAFKTVPKVALTARNAAAAALVAGGVWVTPTINGWSINCTGTPAVSTAYIFDLLSIE